VDGDEELKVFESLAWPPTRPTRSSSGSATPTPSTITWPRSEPRRRKSGQPWGRAPVPPTRVAWTFFRR